MISEENKEQQTTAPVAVPIRRNIRLKTPLTAPIAHRKFGFKLKNIVPWGRNFEEYKAFFGLKESDLQRKILGCGDGPASFNAELSSAGGRCVSVDPIYQISRTAIVDRIDKTILTIREELLANQADFVWSNYKDPDELIDIRLSAMEQFLQDYEKGQAEGRYVNASLPSLPFADDSFDLALCSHLLFTYSKNLSYLFHQQAVLEMLRVAKEVRIFPILTLDGKKSNYFDLLKTTLSPDRVSFEVHDVDYEFQKGGNKMLVLKRLSPQSERDKNSEQ